MIKHLLFGAFTLSLFTGCSQPPASSADPTPVATMMVSETPAEAGTETPISIEDSAFLIVPGERFGAITKESTKESLTAHFGADKVREESIYLVEGTEAPGLAIFPDDDPTRVEVTFGAKGTVEVVQISGEGSLWATEDGITLGSQVSDLERVNGAAFELTGFGWDYGGNVSDWKGGKLQGLNLNLQTEMEGLSEEEAASISGDQVVKSDSETLKKANPTVRKVQLLFPQG